MNNKKIKSDPFYLGKTFADESLRNINTNFGNIFSKQLIEAVSVVEKLQKSYKEQQ